MTIFMSRKNTVCFTVSFIHQDMKLDGYSHPNDFSAAGRQPRRR